MIYCGIHELTVDPKNRLSIPAPIRSAMDPEQDGSRFYIVPGDPETTLSLYADKYFEHYAEKYHSSLKPNKEKGDFEKVFYALATPLDIDKQGRVVLPQRIMEYAGIGRQVAITGARDHLVLWNRAECEQFIERNRSRYQDLLRQAQLLTELSKTNGG